MCATGVYAMTGFGLTFDCQLHVLAAYALVKPDHYCPASRLPSVKPDHYCPASFGIASTTMSLLQVGMQRLLAATGPGAAGGSTLHPLHPL
jgi:hypothetical protein